MGVWDIRSTGWTSCLGTNPRWLKAFCHRRVYCRHHVCGASWSDHARRGSMDGWCTWTGQIVKQISTIRRSRKQPYVRLVLCTRLGEKAEVSMAGYVNIHGTGATTWLRANTVEMSSIDVSWADVAPFFHLQQSIIPTWHIVASPVSERMNTSLVPWIFYWNYENFLNYENFIIKSYWAFI